MESQMLSFQTTVFTNLDMEAAKSLVKSFDEHYIKSGFQVSNVKEAPLFRIESTSDGSYINISLERIDCFCHSYDMSFANKILDHLSKFNNSHAIEITRLAINYVELFLDKDFVLVEKLNKHFKFNDIFGKSEEIMFRLNNEQSLHQLSINVITSLQNAPVTNNVTFEDANGIIVHYDINNKPVERITFDEAKTFINELNEILSNQQNKIKELLSNA